MCPEILPILEFIRVEPALSRINHVQATRQAACYSLSCPQRQAARTFQVHPGKLPMLDLMALADQLDELITSAVPESCKVQKYGGTLYTLKPDEKEGQYCGVFIYKAHVQLSFSKGAELDDPGKLLNGSGKLRRHLNFASIGDIDSEQVVKMLKQAAFM